MPLYSVKECTNPENTFIVSGQSQTIGQVISFSAGEQLYCGIITGTTEVEATGTIINKYDSCCDCFTGNSEDFNSFRFNFCGTETKISVDIQTFCNTYGDVPSTGSVWLLHNLVSGITVCGTFTSPEATLGITEWVPDSPGPFTTCEECLIGTIIYSAGTPYESCVICYDWCGSGTTVTSVSVPHPTWTTPNGNSVVLLDSVVLGGPNGLNS